MSINRTSVSVGTYTTICDVAWENEFKTALNNVITNAVDYTIYQRIIAGMVPTYSSSSTVSFGIGACRDYTNSQDIIFNSVQVLNLQNIGLNGILQSSNLSGTVSSMSPANMSAVSTSTSQMTFSTPHNLSLAQPVVFKTTGTLPAPLVVGTVYYASPINSTISTFHTTAAGAISGANFVNFTSTGSGVTSLDNSYIVGDGTTFTTDLIVTCVISILSGNACQITSIISDTLLQVTVPTTTSLFAASYKRGGLVPNTFYYCYGVGGTGQPSGVVATPRNFSGGNAVVDLPSSYTVFRQLPIALITNSSSNIIQFYVGTGWPSRPTIRFPEYTSLVAGLNLAAATWAGLSLSLIVPEISTEVELYGQVASGGTFLYSNFRPTGSGVPNGRYRETDLYYGNNGFYEIIGTSPTQSIDYFVSGSFMNLYVTAFTVTGVL